MCEQLWRFQEDVMERLAIIYHQSFIDSVLLYHPVDIRQEGPVGVLLLLLTSLHPHLDGGVVEGQLHLLAVHGQLDHVAGDLARVVRVGDHTGDEDTEAVNIASLETLALSFLVELD